ncbi:YwmB family TATA-box binding protein [Bacillus sp. V5-8f]|uniref:YwmB family TATA-box binding protein n=1 Tax=Bacillus sp. V5-8f TaxID=2053044 RepID=UPI0015E06F8C|nr:YwmB family TATA-box binding protein [Bacillus sp. V5-8f]
MLNKIKKILPYILIVGFMGFMFGNSTIVAKSKADIEILTERLQHDRNVNIQEWSVYAREKNNTIKTEQEFNQAVEKIGEAFPKAKWTFVKDNNERKAIAVIKNPDSELTESIRLMASLESNEPVSYLIYEVKGHSWDSRYSAFFENVFQTRKKDIFRGNPSIFSCVKGVFNDNIDTVLSTETARLLDLFKAQEIESIKESNFISLSAQTPMFSQTFTNKQLNLQLALRTEGMGGKTTFVVGTPIITFEY